MNELTHMRLGLARLLGFRLPVLFGLWLVSGTASAPPLAAEAHFGDGNQHGLSRPDDTRSSALVRLDPDFPDRSDPDGAQLITVFVSVLPDDEFPARKETMQRTKETFGYVKLAQFLR